MHTETAVSGQPAKAARVLLRFKQEQEQLVGMVHSPELTWNAKENGSEYGALQCHASFDKGRETAASSES